MANWLKAHKGNFNTASDWSTGTVPGKTDDAIIDAAGRAFTVTATTNEDVRSLQTSANATLLIKGDPNVAHTFTVEDGASNGVSAGAIKVGDNVTLEFISNYDPTLNNSGTVSLNAKTSNSFLDIQSTSPSRGSRSFDIYGGGVILMSDNAGNGIVDTRGYPDNSVYVNNLDNTIMGAGVIGDGGFAYGTAMYFTNDEKGVINATGATSALRLALPTRTAVINSQTYSYGGLLNAGLIEASGKAGLDIAATTVSNAGTIFAGNGSIVRLESSTVEGGLLSTAGTGIVLASGGSTIDGSGAWGTVTNAGVLQDFGEMMYAQGAVTNTGAIKLSDEVTGAVMQVGAAGLTLSGGGTVTLTDNFQNGIQGDGSGSVLVNSDNVISGAGTVGGNQLGLVNASKGVIDATGTYNSLRLYGPGLTFANSGLIETTGKGGLDVAAVTLDQTGGGTLSVSSGSVLNLENAYLVGGTLTNAAGGQVMASDGSSASGTAIINQGTFAVAQADTFSASGSITNSGTFSLIGTGFGGAHLLATGNLTLNGGGLVALGEGGTIDSAAAGSVITNVDNTIGGWGELGNGAGKLVNMAGGHIFTGGTGGEILIEAARLINAGSIDAGQSEISVLSTVTNSGTMQSETDGLLSLTGPVTNNGVLEANGGMLIAYQNVTGSGSAVITGAGLGGDLELMKGFTENVSFTGATGRLYLARSQGYTGAISGFSATGGTTLDLGDIHFVSAGEATFSGTAAGGTLTVTDGTHTAHITLVGDYRGASFTASKDHAGGVTIVASTPDPHAFVAAMAGMSGGTAAAEAVAAAPRRFDQPLIAAPHGVSG